jgi:hypothetical protein
VRRHHLVHKRSAWVSILCNDPQDRIALGEDAGNGVVFDHNHGTDTLAGHQAAGFTDGGLWRGRVQLLPLHHLPNSLTEHHLLQMHRHDATIRIAQKATLISHKLSRVATIDSSIWTPPCCRQIYDALGNWW